MSYTYNLQDLTALYETFTASLEADCRFTSALVGGVPGGREGTERFVKHQLKLEGAEAEAAIARILSEEVRDTTPPEGELKEKESYGVNILRRDDHGPWLGDWMLKACLKAAASKAELFVQKKGSKGDMAELGLVSSYGLSLNGKPDRIHIVDECRDVPAETHWEKFMGRVSNAAGSVSIQHDSECIAPGSRFFFRFRYSDKRIKADDMALVIALAQNIGLGSVKALERGKFACERLVIEDSKRNRKDVKVPEVTA